MSVDDKAAASGSLKVPQKRLAVYVIHATSMTQRVPHIENLRKRLEQSQVLDLVKFEVIEQWDPSDIARAGQKRLQELVDVTPPAPEQVASALSGKNDVQPDGRPGPPVHPPFDRVQETLYAKQASNALKHHAALTMIAEDAITPSDDLFHLVLEDDVVYSRSSVDADICTVVDTAPVDWEMIFLGLPITVDKQKHVGTITPRVVFEKLEEFYSKSNISTIMACDSYLITRAGARKLVQNFLPVRFPTHIHLSWRIGGYARQGARSDARHDAHGATLSSKQCVSPYVRVYSVFPNVFLDGSKLGVFASALTANNRLMWNRGYVAAASLLARLDERSDEQSDERSDAIEAGTGAKARANTGANAGGGAEGGTDGRASRDVLARQHEEEFNRIIDGMGPIRESPDVTSLIAVYQSKLGRYQDAASLMARALSNYKANGCIIDKTSAFLNNYCELFKHLQSDLDVDDDQKKKE